MFKVFAWMCFVRSDSVQLGAIFLPSCSFFLQIKSCISKCEVPLCPNCSLICQLPWNKFALFKTSIWEEQTLLIFTLILKFSQENIQVLENRNTCNRLGNKFSSWKFVVNQSLIRWKMLVKWAVTGLAVWFIL